jgi:hypothetical protein
MKKEELSCNRLSQVMKHGCITVNLQTDVVPWSGNTSHCPGLRILKCAFCQQSDVDTVLGLLTGSSFSTTRVVDNNAWYCAMLEEELKPTIHNKHRGMLTDEVVLHHDNCRPHMTAATVGTIKKLKYDLLPHPAYGPDHALPD